MSVYMRRLLLLLLVFLSIPAGADFRPGEVQRNSTGEAEGFRTITLAARGSGTGQCSRGPDSEIEPDPEPGPVAPRCPSNELVGVGTQCRCQMPSGEWILLGSDKLCLYCYKQECYD